MNILPASQCVTQVGAHSLQHVTQAARVLGLHGCGQQQVVLQQYLYDTVQGWI